MIGKQHSHLPWHIKYQAVSEEEPLPCYLHMWHILPDERANANVCYFGQEVLPLGEAQPLLVVVVEAHVLLIKEILWVAKEHGHPLVKGL